MAEIEKRIESLETQMRLLKGEISKSLLDIRAVVMKAEAPLTDARSLRDVPQQAARARRQDVVEQSEANIPQNHPPAPTPPSMPPQGMAQVPMPPQYIPPFIQPNAQPQAAVGWPEMQLHTAHPGYNPQSYRPQDSQSYHPQDSPGNGSGNGEVPEPRQRGKPPVQGRGVLSQQMGGHKSAGNAHERKSPGESRSSPRPQTRQDRHRDNPRVHDLVRRVIEDEELEEGLLAQEQGLMAEYGLGTNGTKSVNLLTNLVHWTSMARQRMDQDRLMQFLDLYTRWGARAPGLKEIVKDICTMLQDDQGLCGEDGRKSLEGQDWINLMLQLHGVLTEAHVVLAESQNIMNWVGEDPSE